MWRGQASAAACDSWRPSVPSSHQQLYPCYLAGEHVLPPLFDSGVFKDILRFIAASKNVHGSLEYWEFLLVLLSCFSDFSIALGYTESSRELGL